MAQFDVHRNPGRTKAEIPFLVVVQSDRWSGRPDRVVVPLVCSGSVSYRDPTLNPEFIIDGMAVLLHPLQIATIPVSILGAVVANLDEEHLLIIAALDALTAQGL